MKRLLAGLLLASTGAAAAIPSGTAATAGTLQLNAQFAVTNRTVTCPPGAPEGAELCLLVDGSGVAPGLGQATDTYTLIVIPPAPGSSCAHWASTSGSIAVAGKGEIDESLVDPTPATTCVTPTTSSAMLAATVTGGSGVYAGASGALTVRIGLAGTTNFDGWTGTLTVPGLEFDVSPPVLHGVTSKTVRAPKRAKHVRVRYKVTASDAVDGSLAASCKPPSGSSFKIGRTKVTCSATDSSGNTATGRFTVTVRRK